LERFFAPDFEPDRVFAGAFFAVGFEVALVLVGVFVVVPIVTTWPARE